MTRVTALGLGILVAVGVVWTPPLWAQPPVGGGPGGPPVSICPVLAISAVGVPDAGLSHLFSVRTVTDLSIQVIFRTELDRDRVVTLNVLSPRGFLYRTIDVPVAPPRGEGANRSMRVEGYPYPVPVKTAAQTTVGKDTVWIAEVPFPVAGTSIVSSGLYGTWRIETWLDGASQACPGRTSFKLTE